MDTVGYTRQQVQQSSRSYNTLSIDVKSINNKQTGLGVNYSRVKHVRDYFLDKMYFTSTIYKEQRPSGATALRQNFRSRRLSAEKLQKITDDEQEVVSRIARLEKRRTEVTADMANVLNKDVENFKLSNLIEMMASRPAEQAKLARVHDRSAVWYSRQCPY